MQCYMRWWCVFALSAWGFPINTLPRLSDVSDHNSSPDDLRGARKSRWNFNLMKIDDFKAFYLLNCPIVVPHGVDKKFRWNLKNFYWDNDLTQKKTRKIKLMQAINCLIVFLTSFKFYFALSAREIHQKSYSKTTKKQTRKEKQTNKKTLKITFGLLSQEVVNLR